MKRNNGNLLSSAMRVLVFFAANPDLVFTTHEMERKFSLENVRQILRPYVANGLVAKTTYPNRKVEYSAGPALLELI